jgi:hypothetical protein
VLRSEPGAHRLALDDVDLDVARFFAHIAYASVLATLG